MEQKPTSHILNGILQNDRKCQELLYKQFYSYGMSVSLRYTNNRDEAVEVLNDGFMKVLKSGLVELLQFSPGSTKGAEQTAYNLRAAVYRSSFGVRTLSPPENGPLF